MTAQIAGVIQDVLNPRGVAVMIEAEHMCMAMRGIRKQGSTTLTSTFTGTFKDNPEEQIRFVTMVRTAARRLSLDSRLDTAPFRPRWSRTDDHITFPKPPPTRQALEEGAVFSPRFDANGLVTAVVTDADDGMLLMVAHMNAEALALTIETGIAHYWSRSRGTLWKKGETSGNFQQVVEMRTDCDQDAIWLRVNVAGDDATCHTGTAFLFLPAVVAAGGKIGLNRRRQRAFSIPATFR